MRFRKSTPVSRVRPGQAAGAPVFSYYSGRSGSPASRPAARSAWLRNLPWLVAALTMLACLGYVSTLSTWPRIIADSAKTPNLLQDSRVYAETASHILASSLLNRSKLSIDSTAVAEQIKQNHPELADAALIIPLASRRPVLRLQPAEPALVVSAENGSFLVGHDGRVLMPAGRAVAPLVKNLPIINDSSGLATDSGQLILTRDTVTFIRTVVAQLKAASVGPIELSLPAAPHQLEAHLKGEGYTVKFHTLGDARRQSGAFLAVKASLPAGGTRLQYIDVRLEDKVFYK